MLIDIVFSVKCHTQFFLSPDLWQFMWLKIVCKYPIGCSDFKKGSYFMVMSSTYEVIPKKLFCTVSTEWTALVCEMFMVMTTVLKQQSVNAF